MKTFLTKIAAMTMLATAPLAAEPQKLSYQDSFNYVDIGTLLPFPYPGVTVGHREKKDFRAFDISMGVYSILLASDISVSAKYLKYFPNNQGYVGAGACSYVGYYGAYFATVFAPCVTFGKEYESTFIQADLSVVRVSNWGIDMLPGLTFRYGFKL